MSECRTYRAIDVVAMDWVFDFVRDVMGSIKRGHPERPMYIPNLIWGTSHIIATPRHLFAHNAIRRDGRNPNYI